MLRDRTKEEEAKKVEVVRVEAMMAHRRGRSGDDRGQEAESSSALSDWDDDQDSGNSDAKDSETIDNTDLNPIGGSPPNGHLSAASLARPILGPQWKSRRHPTYFHR